MPVSAVEARRTIESGLGGIGLVTSRPLGSDGSLLIFGSLSLLNLFTPGIGTNVVPIDTNSLLRADWSF